MSGSAQLGGQMDSTGRGRGFEMALPGLLGLRCALASALLYGLLRWRGLEVPRDWASWRAFMLPAALATSLACTSPIFAFFFGLALQRGNPPG